MLAFISTITKHLLASINTHFRSVHHFECLSLSSGKFWFCVTNHYFFFLLTSTCMFNVCVFILSQYVRMNFPAPDFAFINLYVLIVVRQHVAYVCSWAERPCRAVVLCNDDTSMPSSLPAPQPLHKPFGYPPLFLSLFLFPSLSPP